MDRFIYKNGAVLPLGDGSICLKQIKSRDGKHIRVYRKQTKNGESQLCMVSGITGSQEAYRMAARVCKGRAFRKSTVLWRHYAGICKPDCHPGTKNTLGKL